jgi:hypothetical protein
MFHSSNASVYNGKSTFNSMMPLPASSIYLRCIEGKTRRMHDIFKKLLNPDPQQFEEHFKSAVFEDWACQITWNTKEIPLNAPNSVIVME